MGSLSEIVTISISASTATAKQPNFGLPLLIGNSQRFPEQIRSYNDPDGMIGDGFLPTDPEVLAANALCAQDPRPPVFKVGRRALPSTMQAKITPTAISSAKYRLILDAVAAEITSDATATVAELTAALKVALDNLSPAAWVKKTAYAVGAKVKKPSGRKYVCIQAGTSEDSDTPAFVAQEAASITDGTCKWKFIGVVPTVTDATTYLTVASPVAGGFFGLAVDDDPATVGHGGMAVEWNHADPGIATDLAAIKAADGDFYGFMLTTAGTAEVKAASAWGETNKRLFIQATAETAVITTAASGATDVAQSLKDQSEFRTAIMFHRIPSEFADAAWMGARFTLDAGSETWADVQLASVTRDRLTSTHLTNLRAKNANFVTDFGGLTVSREGKTAGGEWIDVIRGRDWLEADMQAGIYTAMVAAARTGKMPFTNKGIGSIQSQVEASLGRAESRTFVDKGSSKVTAPDVLSVSTADRANRNLPGVAFSGRLAGAIHLVTVRGAVSP